MEVNRNAFFFFVCLFNSTKEDELNILEAKDGDWRAGEEMVWGRNMIVQ